MQETKTPPTVGRILHCYSDHWQGPRASIVSAASAGSTVVNVNVFLDGWNDQEVLAFARLAESGNTCRSVPVFDMEPGETPDLNGGAYSEPFGRILAVWPPRA